MSCTSSSATFAPIPVWTRKNDADWNFHPLGAPMDAQGFRSVRASFELAQSSGSITIRPAFRTSNDGQTWDAPLAIGSQTRSSNGTTYGASYVDLSAATEPRQLVQAGIEARNTSGAGLEMGLATLKLDLRSV